MSARTNTYFVPGEGIHREVIQADICRYLGNDALVRPGEHNARQGYFVTAYRNLTSEMIADLRADSLRWQAERQDSRGTASRDSKGNRKPDAAPVAYQASRTHQSRQYYGPTPSSQEPQTGPIYAQTPQPGYESSYTYAQQGPYGQSGANQYGYPADAYGAQSQPRTGPYQQQPAYPGGYGDPAMVDPRIANSDRSQTYYSPGQQPTPRSGPPYQQPRDAYGRGNY